MKTIELEKLETALDDTNTEVYLIDVLGPKSFSKFHIPGAINISVESDDFIEQVRSAVPDKDDMIVTYCKDIDCSASDRAAEKIVEDGYTNVNVFKEGKVGWRDAGKKVEFDTEKMAG